MRRRGPAVAAAVALAVTTSACVLVPGMGGAPEMDTAPVGPRIELGPVPTFHDDGTAEPGHRVTFFQTRDGWCTESRNGGSCSGGGGIPTEGFSGLSGSEGPDGTCFETVTGKDVVELRVETPDGRWTTLPPLAGSEEAPVAVFAACWSRQIPFDDLVVEARGADGEVVGTHEVRGPTGR